MTDYTKTILLFTALAGLGYVVFHGHRLAQDCWLCPYRGLAFASGTMGLGVMVANS
ncbi:hypothetical protein [endosymbiont GvMRE of Glomus versiforme]|uniref:hypothetical protein n=1 Tax=endosymbiont GvMRE of Glomus versiforme TaxID=2039283 RepID=UPI000ECB34E8|nr:hypothetical protein [endosymbiont GvMRE of Glomus versiforme]RHZ35562.1 hypothetical protein GvMRE_IIg15 [endosymbiont GvMRE of Glomus versiforme]